MRIKGKNVLKLNEATVIEALQEYLERSSVEAKFKITAVAEHNRGSWDAGFHVQIEEIDDV